MVAEGRKGRQPEKSWIVDAYRRENGRYPIGESICRLREPARSRVTNAVFDLLTRGVEGWREGSRSFKFPDAKPIGENLWEVNRKGDLRIMATVEGSTIVLLDVIQKKRQEISPAVMKHLKQLQREARVRRG
jgi:hypothetical protein